MQCLTDRFLSLWLRRFDILMEKKTFSFSCEYITTMVKQAKWLCLDIEDTRILRSAIPLCIIFVAAAADADVDAHVCLFYFIFFPSSLRVRWRQRRWIGGAVVAFCNFSSFVIVLFGEYSARQKIIHVENVRQLIPSGTCMNHHESLDTLHICIHGKENGKVEESGREWEGATERGREQKVSQRYGRYQMYSRMKVQWVCLCEHAASMMMGL